jgi:hypothetical protein
VRLPAGAAGALRHAGAVKQTSTLRLR